MLPVAVAYWSSSDGVAIDILCTSGFTDDVILSYHVTYRWV